MNADDRPWWVVELVEAEAQQLVWRSVAADVVRRARDEGASWADIGRVLGVSKQAAQQRWRT